MTALQIATSDSCVLQPPMPAMRRAEATRRRLRPARAHAAPAAHAAPHTTTPAALSRQLDIVKDDCARLANENGALHRELIEARERAAVQQVRGCAWSAVHAPRRMRALNSGCPPTRTGRLCLAAPGVACAGRCARRGSPHAAAAAARRPGLAQPCKHGPAAPLCPRQHEAYTGAKRLEDRVAELGFWKSQAVGR